MAKINFLKNLSKAIALVEEYHSFQFVAYDKRHKLYECQDLIKELLRDHPKLVAIQLIDGDPKEAANWYQPLPVCGWAIVFKPTLKSSFSLNLVL